MVRYVHTAEILYHLCVQEVHVKKKKRKNVVRGRKIKNQMYGIEKKVLVTVLGFVRVFGLRTALL